jgi:divalent metal cation (Fe/Co/Zn/Cd) transporter
MNRNLGKLDQFIRIVAGLAIFAFLFKDDVISPAWPVLLPVAAILIATAFFSFCPLYTFLGWSTAKNSRPAS